MLESLKSYRTYAKGDMIAWAEERLTHLSSVVSGVATLNRSLDDGRCQIVGLMLASDFIGRPDRQNVAHDVVAATEITLCRFEKSVFEDLVRRSPSLLYRLLEKTNDDLDAARDWMLLLGCKTAREKVAGFLSMLVRRSVHEGTVSPSDGMTVRMPLPRKDLANYTGLSVETTSRQFTRLREDGVIDLPSAREIRVPNLARLFREAREIGSN